MTAQSRGQALQSRELIVPFANHYSHEHRGTTFHKSAQILKSAREKTAGVGFKPTGCQVVTA